MNTLYIKGNIVKARNKIVLRKDNMQIFNPSEVMLFEDGWSVYTPPAVEEVEESKEERYKQHIITLIRERYSVDDEIAILRQRDTKVEEFEEYNTFVENCKKEAHDMVYSEVEGNI